MPTLQLRFPGGRYHATPWGHHVNEGQIEWPPSPWRLLRALVACGFTTQRWSEVPPVARQLIEKLAEVLPSYRLPAASAAHSRHFMPIGTLDKGRERTTLVFDTWANVGDEALLVRWDCELTDEETRQLKQLAECLGYLGRSESWVEAELIEDEVLTSLDFDAVPHRDGIDPGPRWEQGWEQVSLMAPIPPHEYATWQSHKVNAALADFPIPGDKRRPPAKLLKDRAKAVAPFPEGLLDCLTKDTAWWKQHRWSQPPGSQRVLYWRRADTLQVGVPQRASPRSVRPVTTMLLALTTPTRQSIGLAAVQSDAAAGGIVSSRHRGTRCEGRAGQLSGAHGPGRAKFAAAPLPSPRTHPPRGPRRRRASRSPHHSRTDGAGRGGTACHSHSATHVDQGRRRRIATRRRRKRRSQRPALVAPTVGPADRAASRSPARLSRVGERDALCSAPVSQATRSEHVAGTNQRRAGLARSSCRGAGC